MTYCGKCGALLDEEARFCTVCGARVQKTVSEEFQVAADDLVGRVRQLIHEGNVTRIVVKDEQGKVLLEIPATAGVVGVIIAPWLAALGVIAALATRCTIVVERRE